MAPYARTTRYEEAFLPEGKKRPRSLRSLGLASLLDATHGIIPYRSHPLLFYTLSTTQGISYKVRYTSAVHLIIHICDENQINTGGKTNLQGERSW